MINQGKLYACKYSGNWNSYCLKVVQLFRNTVVFLLILFQNILLFRSPTFSTSQYYSSDFRPSYIFVFFLHPNITNSIFSTSYYFLSYLSHPIFSHHQEIYVNNKNNPNLSFKNSFIRFGSWEWWK